MRVTVDLAPLERRVTRGHDRAVDQVLSDWRAAAPKQSGEYAASLRRSDSGERSRVGSSLARAAAMRYGANVGARRGPHHGPVDTFPVAEAYVAAMPEAIRA